METKNNMVPNDVYLFNASLNIDLDVPVYVDEDAFDNDEDCVREEYFTKERIEELKDIFIQMIRNSENPFDICCTDIDGGYNITEDMIFRK